MGLSLSPTNKPLPQAEVLRRIVVAFGEVHISRKDGADFVRASRERLLAMSAPPPVLAGASQEREQQAVRIHLWDPDRPNNAITFMLYNPVDDILILFADGEHEAATSGLVERLSEALGYTQHVV